MKLKVIRRKDIIKIRVKIIEKNQINMEEKPIKLLRNPISES